MAVNRHYGVIPFHVESFPKPTKESYVENIKNINDWNDLFWLSEYIIKRTTIINYKKKRKSTTY